MVTLDMYKQNKNWNGPLQVEHAKCDCGDRTQTMDHLLKCPMLPQECTTEELMEYNETAKECVFQWMDNV